VTKKLVLIVIDGLTPSMFEAAETPALRFLAERGSYGLATSVFPSLTPVCVSSIATGAFPDVHEIPHLVWWHRRQQRFVEYGSSFGAVRAAGISRSIRDTVFEMNRSHLGGRAETIYEALDDAGLVPGAINFTCYRGRTRHLATLPGLPAVYGPRRFFYFSLFESDQTGAPIAVRSRATGSIDAYAAFVGRWLVTRDGFDFLVYYLPDYDFASHVEGPDAAHEALARADTAIAALMDAAGGWDEFLERYAVLLCSDHGQSHVERIATLDVPGGLVTASNRSAMVYTEDPRRAALALDGAEGVETVMFLEDGAVVARREGGEGPDVLHAYPDGARRVEAALRNPNAGEVLVSAAPGWEFADLAGRHHAGGGSHGSLSGADSIVPMLAVGLERVPASITEIKATVLEHFGAGVAHAA
jgi:hypothetical protein